MRRLPVLSLLIILTALPAAARVISYAPYTDRSSISGHHLRTSRMFPLIELDVQPNWWWPVPAGQIVLYDSMGESEPRVVYPSSGSAKIDFVALYEPISLARPFSSPMLLAGARGAGSTFPDGPITIFSADGGASWKRIAELDLATAGPTTDTDIGGPWVHGLGGAVRIGNDAWPFVVSYGEGGLWAISSTGGVKQLVPGIAIAFGQNREGTEYLVRTASHIELIGVNGGRSVLAPADPYAAYSGWIRSDGTPYLQVLRPEGRFLFTWRDNAFQLVLGPYDTLPPIAGSHPTWGGMTMSFFAAPTADFNGAWMIQRGSGKPTTLLRHTPASGIETMWRDVSGPEVEALIAGESGDRVLVQVHRPREVDLERPFVDPALAVWRVGDPMPRHYHELYLNENWNKGFVHVDVDGLQSGKPFVFDSGVLQEDGGVIISPPPPAGGGGDVMQEWGVVRASLEQHLVLPGIARLPGAYGSSWVSDILLYNPLDEEQRVTVRFTGLGDEVVAALANDLELILKAHELRPVRDVLLTLFGIENGGGALHFLPEEAINVTARTYSRSGEGTYGFGMQAIDYLNSTGPRFPLTFSGAFPGPAFRTNILLTDTSGRGTQATLQAYGVSGEMGTANTTFSAPSRGILQYNAVGGLLGLLPHETGGLVIRPTRGTAIATVVAIDNRTNDPTWFPPDLSAATTRSIPVIGHVDGAHDSHFRSDVYLFNPSDQVSTVTLEAKQWNAATRKMIQFTLLPREARVVRDVLPTLFGLTGFAQLRYDTASGEAVRVTSRTYTIDSTGATYGCLIPPFNQFQIAGAGDSLEIVGVMGEEGFRTNVGLVELTRNAFGEGSVRIWIYDGDRKLLDAFTVSVPMSGGMQLNDLFGSRGIATPDAALIVVEVNQGLIGAYATLTDNVTNDSTFLGAQLAARPN